MHTHTDLERRVLHSERLQRVHRSADGLERPEGRAVRERERRQLRAAGRQRCQRGARDGGGVDLKVLEPGVVPREARHRLRETNACGFRNACCVRGRHRKVKAVKCGARKVRK